MMSKSPMAVGTGLLTSKFTNRMGMGGIATPLGSDISRTKFDFSAYDPKAMRK